MVKSNDHSYIESEKEREKGHVDTRSPNSNAPTRTRAWVAISVSMLRDKTIMAFI